MYSVNLGGTATQSLVSIGTNISSDNASIQNASVNSLSVVEFKTAVFSPHTISTSALNVSSINLDPNFVFPVLNVSTLNSTKESFVNMSVVNISANQITANNIQPLLTAGDNINISNNVISALNNNLPATGNFTTLNTSQLNASNISTGDLTFDSNFTLNDKFLQINSTTNITQNSGDLITSGAVFEAFNRFGTNISDGRSLINIKLIEGGDVIKPIVSGTTNVIDVDVDPGTSKNIMKVFYTTKLGQDANLGVVANFAYVVSGNGFDKITARLEYNDGSTTANIGQSEQIWADQQGGGTRSGVLSPRIGTRRSNVPAQTQVYFQIIIQNDSNDTFTFLNPNACTFQITESLDNDGSDLNLNTGILQANAGTFNSLTVQPGSGSGQATIGRTYLGNNAFSNMASLSVNGNDGATNYGFAQIANHQTVMNAQPGSYNSFRSSNNEIASINNIGLGIGLGVNNTAVFPIHVSGDSLVTGTMFTTDLDSNEADITDISNLNLSGTNATFQEVNISGNLVVNGTTFTTTNLTAGENINISNNVISAFFGSGGQVNLNYIQVDGGVDIGGVLNVSQTSNFSNSLNVGDILYVGEAGNHEGSVVLYSNIVGENYTTKINSSTGEVNCSATGNLNSINFFIGNNRPLEIKNFGIEVTNLQADDITSDTVTTVEAEADVFTCIDGKATFRFNTPQLNASNASIDDATIGVINSSVVTCDVLDTDDLELITLNVSTGNVSILGVINTFTAGQLIRNNVNPGSEARFLLSNTSTGNFSTITASTCNFSNISTSDITAENICALHFIQCERLNASLTATASTLICTEAVEVGEPGSGGAKILFYGSTLSEQAEVTLTDDFNIDTQSVNNINFIIDDAVLMAVNSNGVNASQANLSTINVSLIVAENISGYQETLIAGDNISIIGNTISTLAEPIPSDINFSTINASKIVIDNAGLTDGVGLIVPSSTAYFRDINVSETIAFTGNNFFIGNVAAPAPTNVWFYSLAPSGSIGMTFGINSDNEAEINVRSIFSGIDVFNINFSDFDVIQLDNISTKINNDLFVNTINNSVLNTSSVTCDELQTSGVANFSSVNSSNATFTNISFPINATDFSYNNSQLNLAKSFLQLETDIINNIEFFGLDVSGDLNVSKIEGNIGNFSVINASNLSTATMIFTSDFNLQTFGNVLSLTKPLLSVNEIVTGLRTKDVVTNSLNTSSLNVDGLTSFDIVAISLGLNSTNNNLFNINSSGTANISQGNFSVINASNLSTATMKFGADLTFDTFSNTLSLTTTPEEAISDIETNGLATTSVNTSQLNVDGLTTLDAVAVSLGLNSLVGNINTINSSGSANISVGNFSTINSSVMNINDEVIYQDQTFDTIVIRRYDESTDIPFNLNEIQVWVNDANLMQSTGVTGYFTNWSDKFVPLPADTIQSVVRDVDPFLFDEIIAYGVESSARSPTNAVIVNNIPSTNINDIQALVLYNRGGNGNVIRALKITIELYNSVNDPNLLQPLATTPIVERGVRRYRYNFPSIDTYTLGFSTSDSITQIPEDFEDPNSTFTTITEDAITYDLVMNTNVKINETLNASSITTTADVDIHRDLVVRGEGNIPIISGITLNYTDGNFSSVNTSTLNASTINGYDAIVNVAVGKIDTDGTNIFVKGCSVTRTNVGRYTLTFNTALPNTNYVVQLTSIEPTDLVDDVIITFDSGTATTTGFSYSTHEQDNGGTAGIYIDRAHFVSVLL